ncbi:MAG TPA: fructose PTS transporter subunit IIA [Patescibacteria group bacterium]|nr:fructose PTS transporter subunit IIA [Patescibacteria group bacterium]
MKISDYLRADCCIMDVKATSMEGAIREIVLVMGKAAKIADTDKFISDLLERERLGSTGIGNNVAIPHSPTDSIEGFAIAFGRSSTGIDFRSLDGENVNLIFLMGTNPQELNLYLKLLAKLSKLLIEQSFRRELLSAVNAQQVIDIFRKYEAE